MSGDIWRVEDPISDPQVQEIVNIIEQMLEDVE